LKIVYNFFFSKEGVQDFFECFTPRFNRYLASLVSLKFNFFYHRCGVHCMG